MDIENPEQERKLEIQGRNALLRDMVRRSDRDFTLGIAAILFAAGLWQVTAIAFLLAWFRPY